MVPIPSLNQSEHSILLVDDDGEAVLSLSRALRAAGLSLKMNCATDAQKAVQLAAEHNPVVAVLDLSLDPRCGVESGFALLKDLLSRDSSCRIIVLTGHASLDHGLRALSLGAASFLEKPASMQHLKALIEDGVNQAQLRRAFNELQRKQHKGVDQFLIGASAALARVKEQIVFAAQSPQPILITGETGCGKGHCARAIHRLGPRAQKNMVRYQPNFASSDLVNSELFGHRKGAFTGALQDRRGLLAEAEQSTLFLDEIDELPLEVQVSLLGVLQEKMFRPVGSDREYAASFRLIAATNADVSRALEEGKLRADFFHRIAQLTIHLPPLRERLDDIPVLARHFLSQIQERETTSVLELSPRALEKLSSYAWPGNIRQLEAVVENGVFRAQFNRRLAVDADDIILPQLQPSSGSDDMTPGPLSVSGDFTQLVESYKRKLIKEALARNQGNQVKAARELCLDRSTLRRILERS